MQTRCALCEVQTDAEDIVHQRKTVKLDRLYTFFKGMEKTQSANTPEVTIPADIS
jgi:hypothetical protein